MLIEAKDLVEALKDVRFESLHPRDARGRFAHLPGAHWDPPKPLIREQAYRVLSNRFYADREAINALLDNHDVYVVDDLLCLVEHPDRERFSLNDTSKPITPEIAKHFLSTVHELQTTNPIDTRFVIHLTETPFQAFGYGDNSGIGGFTNPGPHILCVRPAAVTMDSMQWKVFRKSLAIDGWLMPAGEHFEPVDYLLAHEWGHAVYWSGDPASSARLLAQTFRDLEREPGASPLAGLSQYGSQNPSEGYAEAFAQWVLAGWEPNQLGEILAKEEGWESFTSEPIGQPEDDWTLGLPEFQGNPQSFREAASP